MNTQSLLTCTQQFILSLLFILSMQAPALAQIGCVKSFKHAPENNCAPCTTSKRDLEAAKTLLYRKQVEEMITRLERLVQQSASMLSFNGDLRWGRDKLDLDIAKAYEEALKQLKELDIMARADDNYSSAAWGRGMRALDKARNAASDASNSLEWELREVKESGYAYYDMSVEGVASGELEQIWSSSYRIMSLLTTLYQARQGNYNLDCCDPYHKPHAFAYEASDSLNKEIAQMEELFSKMENRFEVNLESLAWFANGYREYSQEAEEDLNRLKNLSFYGVVSSGLVDAGIIRQDQLDDFNQIVQTYNDVTSMQNAIRNTLGDDAADAFSVTVGDMSVDDIRGQFSDYVRNNPGRLPTLERMNRALPNQPEAASVFTRAVSTAENIVQIGIFMAMAMDGGSRITAAKDRWWISTKAIYLATLNSLIQQATALYTLKHMLDVYSSMFEDATISLPGLEPESTEEANKRMEEFLGMPYTSDSSIRVVFGELMCGKLPKQVAASTPTPAWKPTPEATPNRNPHDVELGGICGFSGINVHPVDLFPETGLGQVPVDLLEKDGQVYIPLQLEELKLSNPLWEAGIAVNYQPVKRWEIQVSATGGAYAGKARQPYVRSYEDEVVTEEKMLIPNGTTPPDTTWLPPTMLPSGETETRQLFGDLQRANPSATVPVGTPPPSTVLPLSGSGNYNLDRNEIERGTVVTPGTTIYDTLRVFDTLSTTVADTLSADIKLTVRVFNLELGGQYYLDKKQRFYAGAGLSTLFLTNTKTEYSWNDNNFTDRSNKTDIAPGCYLETGVKLPLTSRLSTSISATFGYNNLHGQHIYRYGARVGIGVRLN